jgi:Flp pilus assembly protein TadB
MRALFALFGAGVGIALLLVVGGLRAPARPDRPARAERRRARASVSALRIAGVLAAAAVVGAATRWPVAAILAAVAAWALPAVLGPDRAQRRTLERVEAIAAWAEDLSGTLRAAAGIEQTILQTAVVAPAGIRTELGRLAEALRAGIRLPDALRAFAADLGDPTADMVVNVLLQAAQHQARDIATGLSGVGRAARRQASSRLRVATGRSRTRTSTRIVICVVLASVVLLTMFAHAFLAPYGAALGQMVLAVLGALFAGALVWMVRTGRIPDLPRILTRTVEEVAP